MQEGPGVRGHSISDVHELQRHNYRHPTKLREGNVLHLSVCSEEGYDVTSWLVPCPFWEDLPSSGSGEGGRGGHAPPPDPVKISHKKDGRIDFMFLSPLPGHWIRYCCIGGVSASGEGVWYWPSGKTICGTKNNVSFCAWRGKVAASETKIYQWMMFTGHVFGTYVVRKLLLRELHTFSCNKSDRVTGVSEARENPSCYSFCRLICVKLCV